jgi:hypothetical protein
MVLIVFEATSHIKMAERAGTMMGRGLDTYHGFEASVKQENDFFNKARVSFLLLRS